MTAATTEVLQHLAGCRLHEATVRGDDQWCETVRYVVEVRDRKLNAGDIVLYGHASEGTDIGAVLQFPEHLEVTENRVDLSAPELRRFAATLLALADDLDPRRRAQSNSVVPFGPLSTVLAVRQPAVAR